MPRLLPYALALAAIGVAAAPAHAQTPTAMTAVFSDIGTRATSTPTVPLTLSINRKDCDDNVQVTILVNNIPATASELDFWQGMGCNDATLRSTSTSTTCNCLNRASQPTLGATMMYVTLPVQDLLGVGECFRPDASAPSCSAGGVPRSCATLGLDGDSTFYVNILAVTTSCSTETPLAYAVVTNGMTTFTVDTVPPDPPTSVTAGSGDTAIPVMWQPPSAGLGLGGTYAVYVDASGGGGGDGGACVFDAVDASGFPTGTAVTSGLSGLSATLDGSALGLAYSSSAGVVVVAVDKALNVSPVSNVACLTRIMSTGFWPRVCDGGTGSSCGISTCSVSAPGAGGATATALFGLALVSFGLAIRYRSRR